jgi:hypothetical protein
MKYYGKEKCRILKEIRAEIAKQNDIEWVVSECKHQGNCKGTCPKCEQEVRQLETALAKREALGKSVAVVGISASIALSVTGCVNPFPNSNTGVDMPVDGEMLSPNETVCDTAAPIPGEEVQTEILMGDMPIEGEIIEPETTGPETETVEEPLAGEPVEYPDYDDEEWGGLSGAVILPGN